MLFLIVALFENTRAKSRTSRKEFTYNAATDAISEGNKLNEIKYCICAKIYFQKNLQLHLHLMYPTDILPREEDSFSLRVVRQHDMENEDIQSPFHLEF